MSGNGWSDFATKRDLDQLEMRLETRIDARFHAFEARVLREMNEQTKAFSLQMQEQTKAFCL